MRINNKKIKRKLTPRRTVNELVVEYMANNHISRRPTRVNRHVGIEVECFGPKSTVDLQKLILSRDLEKYVQIAQDASIRTPVKHHPYELRILVPERQVSLILKKLGRLFKEAKLRVNDTCGLHVHLDMRTRSYMTCYQRLLKFQDILYALVNKKRWKNQYCLYTRGLTDFPSKYRSISGSSYQYKRTLEVRLHEGCVDTVKIEKWIKLLLQIVDGQAAEPVMSKEAVLKWARKPIRSYIKATFNKEWEKEKSKYVTTSQPGSIVSQSQW